MNQVYKNIRYWIGMVLRPHVAFLRLREYKQARHYMHRRLRTDIPTDALPQVRLVAVNHQKNDQKELLRLFRTNPSPQTITPRSRKALAGALAQGTHYYLAHNESGEIIGCIGYQPWRSMIVHLTIDYKDRRGGYGLGITKALVKIKAEEGVTKLGAQVLKGNKRMLNLALSLGFEIEKDKEQPFYHTLYKRLDQK